MSKCVVISIRPKWCDKIVRGEKTCEVRKSRPRLAPPFRVFVYISKGRQRLVEVLHDGDTNYGEIYHGKPVFITVSAEGTYSLRRQCVLGEFICDKILEVSQDTLAEQIKTGALAGFKTGMRVDEFTAYLGDGKAFLWHISDFKIYQPVKPLSAFRSWDAEAGHRMKVPPQSWCYVEPIEEA